MRALVLAFLSLLGPALLTGQDTAIVINPESTPAAVQPGELPRPVAEEAIRFYNAPTTTRLVGRTRRPPGNEWRGNYWDDYEGFDRNNDGVGDTPYEIWAYSDRIWMDNPMAKFFRNSPVLELLDFLERLAPFALPSLILRDPEPQAHPTKTAQQK